MLNFMMVFTSMFAMSPTVDTAHILSTVTIYIQSRKPSIAYCLKYHGHKSCKHFTHKSCCDSDNGEKVNKMWHIWDSVHGHDASFITPGLHRNRVVRICLLPALPSLSNPGCRFTKIQPSIRLHRPRLQPAQICLFILILVLYFKYRTPNLHKCLVWHISSIKMDFSMYLMKRTVFTNINGACCTWNKSVRTEKNVFFVGLTHQSGLLLHAPKGLL